MIYNSFFRITHHHFSEIKGWVGNKIKYHTHTRAHTLLGIGRETALV